MARIRYFRLASVEVRSPLLTTRAQALIPTTSIKTYILKISCVITRPSIEVRQSKNST